VADSTIRLRSFDLLTCQFRLEDSTDEAPPGPPVDAPPEAVSEPDAPVTAGAEDEGDAAVTDLEIAGGDLELEGVSLRYWASVEESDLVLILQTSITDPAAPYHLELVTGSRFDAPDPPVTVEAAAQTLIFISYPYVRETVANITMRSPYLAFQMPPLTRLPHPSVTGETSLPPDEAADVEQPPSEE
jgi:hypothetical protein